MTEGWSFRTAREPATFPLATRRGARDILHAYTGDGTLCGLRSDQIERFLGIFEPDDDDACPTCVRQAAAAPTRPCAQERLHGLVLCSAAGPVRDDLLAALCRGAEIDLWIGGSGTTMRRHYAEVDRVVEGHAAVARALGVEEHVGLAVVIDEPWRYVVVTPLAGPPVVGRGPTS